jgi:septum formation protein
MKIVLGSLSEGRREIFSKYFKDFTIVKSEIDENETVKKLGIYKTNPIFVSMYLSYKKAEDIVNKLEKTEPFLLFTFDTIVVHQGEIKFKPFNKEEARSWLLSYKNDFQEIITGYTIFSSEKNIFVVGHDRCIVYFKDISNEEINKYVDSNPVEKWSGGIAIEIARDFFNIVEGTVESIIGVPINKLKKDLNTLGYNLV